MCGMCVATKNRLSKIMNPWDTLIVWNAKFEGAGELLYIIICLVIARSHALHIAISCMHQLNDTWVTVQFNQS